VDIQYITIKRENLPSIKASLQGTMLNFYTGAGLYLSGSSSDFNQEFLDFYSTIKSVSSYYPPFSATPIEKYTVTEEGNRLEFFLPTNLPVGDFDIIFCNQAGYAKISDEKKILKIIL